MEVKDTDSVGSYRSRNKKLVPVKVLTDSRRGSLGPISVGSASKKGVEDALINLTEFIKKSGMSTAEKNQDSNGSSRSIPVETVDPTQVKKAEFGDTRPLVKDVWSHYPMQEMPMPPKDPRDPLNIILNRKSNFAPKPEMERKEEDDDSNSNEELELENQCHYAMFPQMPLPGDRPSSANAKIDSQTKLPKVEVSEDSEFERAKREGIDLEKHQKAQEENFNYDNGKGKFLRTSEDSKAKPAFKINRHCIPAGVMNEKVWRRIPVSPHVDNQSFRPLEQTKPQVAPINPLHNHSQVQMSIYKSSEKIAISKARNYDLDSRLDSAGHDLPEIHRSSSVKSCQKPKIAFGGSVFTKKKANLFGVNNLVDMGVIKNHPKKNTSNFGALTPFIKHLEDSANHYFTSDKTERTSLNTKTAEQSNVNLFDKRVSTEALFGLKRRRSISNSKEVKIVVNPSVTNSQNRRLSIGRKESKDNIHTKTAS